MTIIACNEMLPLSHPVTGKETHLISLGTRHPGRGRFRDTNALGGPSHLNTARVYRGESTD